MPPELMTLRQQGMLEVVGGIVRHSDFFHHATGSQIRRHGERDDFRQAERAQCVFENSASALGRELPPLAFMRVPSAKG